jgi:hypothetical protein
MEALNTTWQNTPLSALIPVALIVITGLVLWSAGRSVLRAAFAIVGLMVGGIVGWVIGGSFGGAASPWIGALVGGILLAVGAALMYRAAVAVSMSCLIGLASPLAVITMAELQAARSGRTLNDGEVHNPIADKVTQWWNGPPGSASSQPQERETTFEEEVRQESIRRATDALQERIREAPQLQEIRHHGARFVDALKEKWQDTPEKMRPTLILAAVSGAIVGLLFGILASSLSASAVTSFGGSLLWLGGLQILALRFGVPDGPWFPKSGMLWLGIWLITTLAGVVIQWTVQRKRADKPQRQKKPSAETVM